MSTNYLFMVSVTQKIGEVAIYIGSFFGTILILLTLFCVRKIFGTYKYLMTIFTSLGILLGTLELVFHPILHVYNSGFAYFSLVKPFGFGKTAMEVVFSLYAAVYSMTISLIAVQFLYRYWALFSLDYLKYFKGWKSLIWFAYCLFFGVNWFFGIYCLMNMDKTSEEYYKDEILLRYEVYTKDIPMKTFLAFDPIDGSLRFWDSLYIIHCMLMIGSQYSIMIYCGWKMYSKMETKLINLSAALKHHHRQLFKTLVLQISTPTIFLFFPMTVMAILPYLQLEISVPAGAMICAFSIYPAVDTIIVLLVVSEYRMIAKRTWKALLSRRKGQKQATYEIPLATLGGTTSSQVTASTVLSNLSSF